MKLTLYIYFQIPSQINQTWQTTAIQRKAYPKEWDQNKATINRRKPSSIQSNHWEKVGFPLAIKTDSRMTTPYLSAADTTTFSDTDHICWKPPMQTIPESQIIATAMPSVSGVTTWGGTGWF